MCTKAKVERLSTQVLDRIEKLTDNKLEMFVAIKLLQNKLTAFTEEQDFMDEVNNLYEKKEQTLSKDEKVTIIECITKKASARKTWVYSKELQCKMEDVKNEQKKEQISGKAKATLSKIKYLFSVVTK